MNVDTKKFMDACMTEDTEGMKSLIENGVDVNCVDRFGNTALILASRNGFGSVVCFCIENGADVNILSEREGGAIHAACAQARSSILKSLIDAHVLVNACDNKGRNAMHILAKAKGNPKEIAKCIRFVLSSGGTFATKTKANETVEQLAGGKRSLMMQLIKEHEEGKELDFGVPASVIQAAWCNLAAVGDGSGNIYVITTDGCVLHKLVSDPIIDTAHTGAITKLSVEGDQMYSGSDDCSVQVWNLKNYQPQISFNLPCVVTDWAISGEFVVCCTPESSTRMFSLFDGFECKMEAQKKPCLAVAATDEFIFVGNADGLFRYFSDGSFDREVHASEVSALEMLDDQHVLCAIGSGTEEGVVSLIDINSLDIKTKLNDFHKEKVDYIHVSGNYIATVSSSNAEVAVWTSNGRCLQKFEVTDMGKKDTKWACSNGSILLSHSFGVLIAWEIETGRTIFRQQLVLRETLTAGCIFVK